MSSLDCIIFDLCIFLRPTLMFMLDTVCNKTVCWEETSCQLMQRCFEKKIPFAIFCRPEMELAGFPKIWCLLKKLHGVTSKIILIVLTTFGVRNVSLSLTHTHTHTHIFHKHQILEFVFSFYIYDYIQQLIHIQCCKT